MYYIYEKIAKPAYKVWGRPIHTKYSSCSSSNCTLTPDFSQCLKTSHCNTCMSSVIESGRVGQCAAAEYSSPGVCLFLILPRV